MLRPYIPPTGYQYDPETDTQTAINPADPWESGSVYHPLRAARNALSRARARVTYYRNLATRAECAPAVNAAKTRQWRAKEQEAIQECNDWQKRIDSILLLQA